MQILIKILIAIALLAFISLIVGELGGTLTHKPIFDRLFLFGAVVLTTYAIVIALGGFVLFWIEAGKL